MRKNKIRILHVAQAAGGVDRYIRMLLKYLDKEKFENNPTMAVDYFFMLSGFGLCLSTKRPSITFRNCIRYAICKMAASTMYRKSPGALAAGGRCLIGCILSRLSGDKKTMRRSRNRKEAEKVKIP